MRQQTEARLTQSGWQMLQQRAPEYEQQLAALGPSQAAAWQEVQQRRVREQQAEIRARAEYLQQQLQVAQEDGDTTARVRIEAEMTALANQTSGRMRNALRREDAAYRAQIQFAQAGQEIARFPPAQPIQEGSPPAAIQAFESSLVLTEEVRARRSRIQNAWEPIPADVDAEKARFELGRALDQAVKAKLFDEWRGLLLVGAAGINVEPIPVSDVRTLLFTLLAQAVQSRMVSPGRARIVAEIIRSAPTKVKDETPAEVTIPETVDPTDLAGLRALALDAVPLDGSPLTPSGLKASGDALQQIARVVPGLADRLETLESVVYDALTVFPCHQGHDIHLQTRLLCTEQAGDLAFSLIAGLGLSNRELPRDVHREPNGEKASCCEKDGRIGTWLIHGQYVNPDLRSGPERKVKEGS